MINEIMMEEIIKTGTDQITDIEGLIIDKIEVNIGMNRITGMITGEEIF